MTTSKPIWYLDVDGVINAVTLSPPAGYDTGMADGFIMQWNPRVIELINLLIRSEEVEIAWLTTWEHDANAYIRPLMGIEREFPVITREETEAWWKWDALKETHESGRIAVWTDDELAIEKTAADWAKKESILTMSPNPYKGLVVNDMIVISRHLNSAAL